MDFRETKNKQLNVILICRASTQGKTDLGPSVCYKQGEGYFAYQCFSMLCFQHLRVGTLAFKGPRIYKEQWKNNLGKAKKFYATVSPLIVCYLNEKI